MRASTSILIVAVSSLLLLSHPAGSIIEKTHGSGGASEGWWFPQEINDASIAPLTDKSPMCRRRSGTTAAFNDGCTLPRAIIITGHSFVATRPLTVGADEVGTIYIEVSGVRKNESDIKVGDGNTAVCDIIYDSDSDGFIDAKSDSCTQMVAIPVAADEPWQIGYATLEELQGGTHYVWGIYND